MDREEQTRLFHQRLLPLRGENVERYFYLEKVTAIMNDFPIDITDEDRYSLLHDTCAVHDPELYEPIIRQLIEQGADINVYRYGSEDWCDVTPIATATRYAIIGVITFLLQCGPALSVSVRKGYLDIMSILLEAGAHPHGPVMHACYPIDHAVVHKRLEFFKALNEAVNTSFPYSYEVLFAKESYCKPTEDDNIYGGVECLSYLINWNWEGLEKPCRIKRSKSGWKAFKNGLILKT